MLELKGNEERSTTTDQQAEDQDAEQKKQMAENANKRAAASDVAEGDKVLLLKNEGLLARNTNIKDLLGKAKLW